MSWGLKEKVHEIEEREFVEWKIQSKSCKDRSDWRRARDLTFERTTLMCPSFHALDLHMKRLQRYSDTTIKTWILDPFTIQ
jgi:hypothetical protein